MPTMRPSRLRVLVWLLANGILAPLTMIVCLAAAADWQTGALAAGAIALLAWPCITAGVPARLRETAGRARLLFIAFIVLGILACLRTVGTGTFMLDATDKTHALEGVDGFASRHNCFTCMVVGSHLARHGAENIYDKRRYRTAEESLRTPVHAAIGTTLSIDPLPYPPPSLLIPRLLQAAGQQFYPLRSTWFAISLLALLAALAASASWAGAFDRNRALLLFPAVLLAPNVVIALQIGNVQVVVVAFSILAMLAFAKGWHGTGAALLGYAILTKIWPAVLLAYLLLGRRWRPVGSTLVAIVLYCLATLAAFGAKPFESFLTYQLPQLASGEAFSFMKTSARAMLANMSVFGWPHKLHALGLAPDYPLLPAALNWSYTGFLAAVVLLAGLRQARWDGDRPLVAVRTWLAILTLTQLRSPFLPAAYGVLSTLCLLLFLLPGAPPWRAALTVLAFGIAALDVPAFAEEPPQTVNMMWALGDSSIAFLASMAALLPLMFWHRGRAGAPADGGPVVRQ